MNDQTERKNVTKQKHNKNKGIKDSKNRQVRYVNALVAKVNGEIFELPGYAAVGMAGDTYVPLTMENTSAMPYGSELMLLPDRIPVVFNIRTKHFETLTDDPFEPGRPIFPVAVFNSPGYVNTFVSAYEERDKAGFLPLFSYGAGGWGAGGFRSSVVRVDREPRQDLRLMPDDKIHNGVKRLRNMFPDNRLRSHLEHCALVSGCPAAKNFFIGRCEAPLPTSRQCNARCLGCISLQNDTGMSCCQERIAFTPTPEEIRQIAVTHIETVPDGVVSFGQGCEGDPLMVSEVLCEAVKEIRNTTEKGTINLNSNASLPGAVEKLFESGLDSIRVSMNSVRRECYTAYFRPQGYEFPHVLESIRIAAKNEGHVAINYLNCPGVTDTPEEFETLSRFLSENPVHLIQWRNMNFDPLRYRKIMEQAGSLGKPLGMAHVIATLKQKFPRLKHGYFNPPKERF
jgi:pyruvate-formate lyase-activating enzyme